MDLSVDRRCDSEPYRCAYRCANREQSHRSTKVPNEPASSDSIVSMTLVRIILGALIALLVVVVAIPAAALLDLVIGGTGLGLCADGLAACDTSLFTVLELALILVVLGTILAFGVAGCIRALSRSHTRAGL